MHSIHIINAPKTCASCTGARENFFMYSTYKMNITELPLEILEKVTLLLRNIWDLECWLMCAYMLEDLKSVQIQRYKLTIEKGKEENFFLEFNFCG